MAHPKIDDERLADALLEVFRKHGFEGASLSKLSQATGLQRASLYHRFPGGKEEMAAVVLATAEAKVHESILTPLEGPGDPQTRLQRMIEGVRKFYRGGEQACLLESLSVGEPEAERGKRIDAAIRAWIEALAHLAEEAGMSRKEACRRAEEAVILIQGGLVVSRARQDTGPFERTLRDLPKKLLGTHSLSQTRKKTEGRRAHDS